VDNLGSQHPARTAVISGATEEKLDKTNINKDNRPVGLPYGPVDDFVDDWAKTLCKAGGPGCAQAVAKL